MSKEDNAFSETDAPADLETALRAIARRIDATGGTPSIASCVAAIRRQARPTVNSWAALAQALSAAGWLDEAEAVFRAMAAQYPGESAGSVELARIAARRRKWALALELWTSCLRRFPAQAGPQWLAEFATTLAHVGRHDEADAVFLGLTESHPQNHAGFVGLARSAMQRRRWDVAEERWAACLERFPVEAKAAWRVARGDALMELGRLQEATALFCEVLRAVPDHPTVVLRLAAIASPEDPRIHDLLLAAATKLKRAVEREPNDAEAHRRLGMLQQAVGRLDLAIGHFQESLTQWRQQRPVRTRRSRASATRRTGEIHLVSPFRAVGGRTGRCIELFRVLETRCPVRLWTLAEFGPPAPIFVQNFTIETIALEADHFPRHGTLVLVGPDMTLDWLRATDPDRVIQICNVLDSAAMMAALDAYDGAGLRNVEFVYASELIRDAMGTPGIVQQSLIDLDRFKPQSRAARKTNEFVIGRLSRDALSKHSLDDPDLYRALVKAGCHIRLMGATCLEPRLRGVAGVELLPARGDAAATFLQGLDCFLYRTSNAWVEASARVISEAMACGLPVVCHRNGGYREIIEDGRNGFLFDTNAEAEDIVLRLKADRDLRRAVGIQARLTAEALNGPAARQAVVDFYLGRTP